MSKLATALDSLEGGDILRAHFPTVAPVPASGVAASEGSLGSAPRREEHVDALDDYFLPSVVQVAPGGTVVWDFTGSRTHTATDATGMELFDSGLVANTGGASISFGPGPSTFVTVEVETGGGSTVWTYTVGCVP